MHRQAEIDYARIETAIAFIMDHIDDNPSLADIAGAACVSPFHFQRLFTKWAGVSPKQFIGFMRLGHAKRLLRSDKSSLLQTALGAGLSGPGRLHDLFVSIEGMTPGTFKKGGAGLVINHSMANSPFGNVMIASTPKGVCHMAFETDPDAGMARLQMAFPKAQFSAQTDRLQQQALSIFQRDWTDLDSVKLHLHGTPFQLRVWQALLDIPFAMLASYGDVATAIGVPGASRAVGTAIGNNPVAFLIPCHRVIRRTGNLGGYRWTAGRKQAIIAWEAARVSAEQCGR